MMKNKTLYVWEMSKKLYGGGILISGKKNINPGYGMEYSGTLNQWLNKAVIPEIKKNGIYENSYVE